MSITWKIILGVLAFSIALMFFWEGKVGVWWLRLPVINLVLLVFLLVAGIIEEIYLTFHPKERTKWIKTSVFQRFF
jgi:hypothetical protein